MNKSTPYKNTFFPTLGKSSLLSFLFLAAFSAPCFAQATVTIGGSNWTAPISAITEAGSNYPQNLESSANQVLVSASLPALLSGARVSVHYQPDPIWNGSLSIAARRTGNGQTLCLLCAVTGGTTYQPVTTVATEMFRIQTLLTLTTFNNIPVQLRLSGASVTIPAATYRARIVFTISGIQ